MAYICVTMEVILSVIKLNVYAEVAETTNFAGAKMMDADKAAYVRMAIKDDDRQLLERFWTEACGAVTRLVKPYLVSVTPQPVSHGLDLTVNYEATLNVPSGYNPAVTDSVNGSLFSFFTEYIISKWYEVSNKDGVQRAEQSATTALEDVANKLFAIKPPRRKGHPF